jgi:SAM-dependent methyltransferase
VVANMTRPWEKTMNLTKRILEIGPLDRPIFKKENSNVFYADIRDTQAVKNFYRNDNDINVEAIVEIDYVIKGTYSESIAANEKFDYIVMSHVIEHIPELIKFFEDVKNVLNPNGKLCLAVPDHRFCFDHFRQPTSFAEAYDIYVRGIKNLPSRVVDYSLAVTKNDCIYWWDNFASFEYLPRSKEQFESAKEKYLRASKGEYIDVHFSVFTPETFLLLLYNMLNFNLLPFKCSEFYNTNINSVEFNCVLELEPNLLVENSAEHEREKENLIELLINTKRDMIEKDLYVYIENLQKKSSKNQP